MLHINQNSGQNYACTKQCRLNTKFITQKFHILNPHKFAEYFKHVGEPTIKFLEIFTKGIIPKKFKQQAKF